MNDKLENIWTEEVVANRVLPRRLPGGTEENLRLAGEGTETPTPSV